MEIKTNKYDYKIIVSSLLSNINNNRSTDTYIEYGKKILYEPHAHVILFIEKNIFYKHLPEFDSKIIHTFILFGKEYEFILHYKKIFIFIEKEDNYLYEYHQLITNFQVNTDNPNKDTIDYMFCMCYKTECMKMAIHFIKQHNLFEDKIEYIWLDFGIYHMINDENKFKEELNNMLNRPLSNTNKIRIASFCSNIDNRFDLTKNVCWFFLGSIFGGCEEELLLFSDLMRETSIQFIHNHKSFIWEINLWYIIYLKNKELFDCYYCNNHNIQTIQNY
jgi:hypothetical protein